MDTYTRLHISSEWLSYHETKLFEQRAKHSLKKNSFGLRTVQIWNDLPEHIVNASSLNSFKNQLDKYWSDQSLLYDDCTANIITKQRDSVFMEEEMESSQENLRSLLWKAALSK